MPPSDSDEADETPRAVFNVQMRSSARTGGFAAFRLFTMRGLASPLNDAFGVIRILTHANENTH
jgi:hypothetical protein